MSGGASKPSARKRKPDSRTLEAEVCIYGGTAAGVVAAVAIDLALLDGSALQDVPYDALRPELDKAGQVMELPSDLAGV